MNSSRFITQVLYFVFLVGLQLLLFRNLVMFNYAFCFVYVGFILWLPREMNPVLVMLLAFGTGLFIDWFYDTSGIHAAASVLVAFLRPYLLKGLTPGGGYEAGDDISVRLMGPQWLTLFMLPLLLAFHLALFGIEAATWELSGWILLKALSSTLFTYAILLLIQYTVHSPRARR
ncbi:hypothetical protein SAMN05421823_108132 [Catalinimonas alkaloidigena]|uniref:Rod shape-determining protein MreD n=1 Tax=Catalinimonas alkaloidigena TaxID=1075417 RepID=A0A1G9MZX1_9BACT|nr:hypothetical protein [Catalinimonas alkaloidigena]SDL79551.1 hypothetical protein SAMN05421823_108132 [Catalinimonas alkaloidigena]